MAVINQLIDIKKFLSDHGIAYSESGKNISRDWIGTSCVFCGDTSNHLGISPTNVFSCFRCGEKGNALKLIKYVADVSWSKAKDIAELYTDTDLLEQTNKLLKTNKKQLKQLKYCTPIDQDNIPKLISEFLIRRRFDKQVLFRNHVLYANSPLSDIKFRLVAPVILDGRIVNYIAADLTGKHEIKYKPCPNDEAVTAIHDTLYGYDDLPTKHVVTIVEGLLDQWRMGFGSVGVMSSILTKGQVALIKKLKPKKVNILLDADAIRKAENMAKKLWFTEVEIIELSEGDPADLTDQEAMEIMKELNHE